VNTRVRRQGFEPRTRGIKNPQENVFWFIFSYQVLPEHAAATDLFAAFGDLVQPFDALAATWFGLRASVWQAARVALRFAVTAAGAALLPVPGRPESRVRGASARSSSPVWVVTATLTPDKPGTRQGRLPWMPGMRLRAGSGRPRQRGERPIQGAGFPLMPEPGVKAFRA
jgi:hypothetical protein